MAAPGWAAAGAPAYLAAARSVDGAYRLAGLDASGAPIFELPLPGRGHAAAAHPLRPEAVAFARRPGAFALVIDCAAGHETARLDAPEGRHFYGHGAFSRDGAMLFTTENAYQTGEGRIGVWDARDGYRRIGEVASGGIGPHDICLTPDGSMLVVANGGIRTHPSSGREKLNLDTMRASLAYVRASDGALQAEARLPEALRLGSIRHLSVAPDGLVAAAMQWQGDPDEGVPLLAFHRPEWPGLLLAEAEPHVLARMKGYAGSVSFDAVGRAAAITSPRGGLALAWDRQGAQIAGWAREDVCGIASGAGAGWVATDGLGGVTLLDKDLAPIAASRAPGAWDNHLVGL
ncbi:DUF1513 domain-containing protein [Limibaculum sp. M0105]|uniref:DUF1513 domain-containing protein n=1 Tax=Thermohalobaculum xanthum TaxID=2753746 RepID=A0A8J7M4V0_9RHOB|nr:DUF1513 domain-containing protein [Thermohalobaculum xanthum]MBK0398243.1 DUF1513 domain-containing protein [Thermohalobaculum xanthum]